MGDTVQRLETDLLLEAVFRLLGSDYRAYERSVVAAKLDDFMRIHAFETISSLQGAVIHDPVVAGNLLRALAFRPAGLFDQASAFSSLRELAEPLLRSYARPKIWLPECATVEELASLAILLEEAGIQNRALIHATCSNPLLLGEIRQGRFALGKVDEYEENYRASGGKASFSRYWTKKGRSAVFRPDLLRNVIFSEYNLGTDNSFNEFHLIACRGRLMEFGPVLRRRVLDLFAGSLVRFGILFVDPEDELALGPCAHDYRALSREYGIYRRTSHLGALHHAGVSA